MKITYEQHLKNMEVMAPYVDLMTDADEFEQAAKALYDFHEANYLSEEFQQAYYKEIKTTLKWLKENVKIKEEKEKVITKVKSYKFLEYNDE